MGAMPMNEEKGLSLAPLRHFPVREMRSRDLTLSSQQKYRSLVPRTPPPRPPKKDHKYDAYVPPDVTSQMQLKLPAIRRIVACVFY